MDNPHRQQYDEVVDDLRLRASIREINEGQRNPVRVIEMSPPPSPPAITPKRNWTSVASDVSISPQQISVSPQQEAIHDDGIPYVHETDKGQARIARRQQREAKRKAAKCSRQSTTSIDIAPNVQDDESKSEKMDEKVCCVS